MRLAPVIERMSADGFQRVKGASALSQLRERPPQTLPAFFVAPERETAEAPGRVMGIHDQNIGCDFLVVIYVSTAGLDPDAADAELETLAAKTEQLLVGWAHPDAEGTGTASGGSALFDLAPGRIAWMLRFKTRRRIRCAVTAS